MSTTRCSRLRFSTGRNNSVLFPLSLWLQCESGMSTIQMFSHNCYYALKYESQQPDSQVFTAVYALLTVRRAPRHGSYSKLARS